MEPPDERWPENVSKVNSDFSGMSRHPEQLCVRTRVNEFHEQSQNLLKLPNVVAVGEFGARNE